jgi:uracil-DNA glycosylase
LSGFFKGSELKLVKAPSARVPQCGVCGLWRGCKTPKMEVSGKGKRRILIVGEAPGADEDTQGKPFVGVTDSYSGRH